MKYELGDKVKIKQYWKRANFSDQLEKMGFDNQEEFEIHLRSEEMVGDTVSLVKHVKVPVNEEGIVIGVRQVKTEYRIWHLYQEPFETGMGVMPEIDRIEQESADYEKVYLVATNLNCIRKVSFEDIQFVG
jgi:hypothetical protein